MKGGDTGVRPSGSTWTCSLTLACEMSNQCSSQNSGNIAVPQSSEENWATKGGVSISDAAKILALQELAYSNADNAH